MISCAIPISVRRCDGLTSPANSWAMVLAEARVSQALARRSSFLVSAVTAYMARGLKGGGVEPGGQR